MTTPATWRAIGAARKVSPAAGHTFKYMAAEPRISPVLRVTET